ncbi:hypothetical protein SADUNF_Sadunf15G0084300 [Salix dunnii]|uniref:Uncharacterized protein n=1 Tax=Salix dunnii TaxID=1413687 RepID=A0A835MJE4_9ROSI|nr:hypothetical protein SADUNF_Sadunf15G0084300 [Salix dunnii]
MFLSAAEIKCGIELLAQQLEAGDSRRDIRSDKTNDFKLGIYRKKGFTFKLKSNNCLTNETDGGEVISEDMVLEILRDSHFKGRSSEEFNAVLDSTTCKTQVQFHTGQGQSMLRYWAFSYSYPFQQ